MKFCRECGEEVVRPPGRPGMLPSVCYACQEDMTAWEIRSPEARRNHIERELRRQRDNPELHAEYVRRTYWRLKLQAFDVLGGRCVNCGTSNPLVLTINHVDGRNDGDTDTSRDLYRRVAEGEGGFDLRCCNCQRLYEYERGANKLPTGDEFVHLKEAFHAICRL